MMFSAVSSLRLAQTPRVFREVDTTIRIGGPGGAFVPECELRRWETQWVRLRLLHDEAGIVSVDQQAVVWTAPSIEARWYRLPGQRFECATIFYGTVPDVVRFAYETSADIATTRQPMLAHLAADGSTWESNGRGGERHRPVDVGDSFAAYVPWSGDYTRCGGWNFQSGKVAHLFRPWIVDAVGHQAWCAVVLERGVLTIRIPADFRAIAIGPCLLDPTFGYSGTAASDDNVGQAHIWLRSVTAPASNGSLDSITVKGRIRASGGGVPTFEPGLYANSGTAPSTRLAAVDTGGTQFTGSDAEVTTAIAYGSLVSGTQYWLGLRGDTCEGANIDFWFKYDASGGATNFQYDLPAVGANWETPANVTGTLDNEKVYIYASYTASASGTDEWLNRTAGNTLRRPVQIAY